MGGNRILLLFLALAIACPTTEALAQPAERTCGMIGCTEHGDGEIIKKDNDGTRIVVEFEVGTEGYAPYARERLTLAPQLRRNGTVLSVEYHGASERRAAKISRGFGALLEIDLSKEEGAVLQQGFLAQAAGALQPPGGDGSHAELTVRP